MQLFINICTICVIGQREGIDIYYKLGKNAFMKSHQNKLDRFSVIAKKLVDEHATELYHDIKTSTNETVYYNHLNTLGKQLNDYAVEFIKSCKIKNDQFINDVWWTCNKYLDLFAKNNEPSKYNRYF